MAAMQTSGRVNGRINGIVSMDNFTVAVLVTAAPFALLLIYGFWSGQLRLDGEPHRKHRGDGDDASGRPG